MTVNLFRGVLRSTPPSAFARRSMALDRVSNGPYTGATMRAVLVAAALAAALVEQSKPGLVAQGLTVERVAPGPHDGVQVDARAAKRNQALRQLYLVRSVGGTGPDGKQAIVITLAAPVADLAAAAGPYEWVLAHLTLEAPVRPDAKPEGKPDAGR